MRLSNPLEEDPLLKELLKQLDRIETRRGFAKWKSQFLEQFEVHLEGTNVTKAGQKYHAFAKRLDRLALLLKKMEGFISSGECSEDHCTVKARQSLSELQKALTGMIRHTEALVPGTYEMEKECGYTKFDMGAVLVRDGFVEYDRLCICNEILLHMREILLASVADRQLLEEMDRYWTKVQVFYQIMGTDLGLDKAIMRCRKILRADDDEFFEITEAQAAAIDNGGLQVKSLYSDDTESELDTVDDVRTENNLSPQEEQKSKSELQLDGTGSHGSKKGKKNTKKKSKGGLDELDERQKPSGQRYEKVEIYGLDLPLRLIKIGDDSSATDLSSVSDYDSWCWELELPEPTPPPPPPPKSQTPTAEPISEEEQVGEGSPSSLLSKSLDKPLPDEEVEKASPKHSEGADQLNDGNTLEVQRYRWTGKDYYHGADAAGWRIAGTLKKARGKPDATAAPTSPVPAATASTSS
ncbi:hypothetical protein ACA910_008864 [Epithemia clementina (nom. ined.)]